MKQWRGRGGGDGHGGRKVNVPQILLSKLMQWHTAIFLTILLLQNNNHSK